ncbi:GntR family transcriptional regulator [Kitasatospora purpeofusca]|uniref:GntR family transcriptional regulator n=1 Tax=Kitasatospora purpeofusca TaxID=67352 RepID=UPI002A59ED79|nr:GntR family transcriptional regulator [Kitasatospora purpeofusca]MDY0814596.1 GntR family transcriptional regulator [Kitasatospora purpeofusca]
MFGTGAGGTRPVIQRNSLREQIAGALREEMMAGRLAAGRNFTVKEIAELYGVSATPAREALVDLAAQGLLRAEHHRGFTVPEFGWDDFLEIFESRVLITDSYFRRLAAHPGAPDDSRLPSLRRRADAAVRAARAGNLDVMVGCDRRFWQEVAGLLGNRRIADYLDWLRVQSWMFAARYLRSMPELGGVCWDSHLDLVDAIEARDVPRVHRIVCEYNLFTVGLLAELAGQQVETVGVLPLLTGRPVAAPGGPGAQDGPVAARAPRTAEEPAEEAEAGSALRPDSAARLPWTEGGAGPEQSAPGTAPHPEEPGREAGGARGHERESGHELGRELGRELGLGLGLVPQPRSVPYGRFGRRLPEPPSGRLPEGRPGPHRAPGR